MKHYVKRLKGKPPKDIARTLKQSGVFYRRRIFNLIREYRYRLWVPSEKEIFNLLSKDIKCQHEIFDNVIPIWESRLRNAMFSCSNSKKFKELFVQLYPREKELIDDAALNISKGDLTLFRYFKVNLGRDINWHSTVINKNSWPVIYFRKINVRESAKIGDLRTTWELNRHLHWLTLGKAYFLTNKIEHFDLFWNQLESWTKTNPYLLGVNWLSAMEVAIRLNHWLTAYALFCDCPNFDKKEKIRFWCWVYLHIHFLFHHLTLEDRGFRNNHSIIEAATLYISSLLLGEFKDSSNWFLKSKRILSEELRIQFLNDGFHEELSSTYHLQVTEAYLFSALIGERCGFTSAPEWKEGILKMIQVLYKIVKQDGNLPMLGDSDDGTFIGIDVNRKNFNIKTIVDVASSWLKREKIQSLDSHMSEGAFWLCGADVDPLMNRSFTKKQCPKNEVLESAQIAVFKDCANVGYNYSLFSVGTKQPSRNMGHRHADLLSLDLTIKSHDIFVDPGTYCYNGPLQWRRFFQSTKSHNTVVINGQDQFHFIGHFGLSRIDYQSDLKTWTVDGITIFRGKYISKNRRVWHCRYVIFMLPDFIIIRDSCSEGEYSNAMLNFTFSPIVTLYPHQEHILCNVADSFQFQIDLYNKEHTFKEIGQLCDKWFSPSYWVKEKCTSVEIHANGYINFFTTILNCSVDASYMRKFFSSEFNTKESLIFSIVDKKISLEFYNDITKNINNLSNLKNSCLIQVDSHSLQNQVLRVDI